MVRNITVLERYGFRGLIRGIYVLDKKHRVIYSRVYSEQEHSDHLREILSNIALSLDTLQYTSRRGSIDFPPIRLLCMKDGDFTFVFDTNSEDSGELLKDQMEEIVSVFMKDFDKTPTQPNELDKLGKEIDRITSVNMKIVGYSRYDYDKDWLWHQLKQGELRLVFDKTGNASERMLPPEIVNPPAYDGVDMFIDVSPEYLSHGIYRPSFSRRKLISEAQIVILITDGTLEDVLHTRKMLDGVRQNNQLVNTIIAINDQKEASFDIEKIEQLLHAPIYAIPMPDTYS